MITGRSEELAMSGEVQSMCKEAYRRGQMDKSLEKPPLPLEFVLEEIAEMFDDPCQWGNVDEYMLFKCGEWCAENCGRVKPSACWWKYLEERRKEVLK